MNFLLGMWLNSAVVTSGGVTPSNAIVDINSVHISDINGDIIVSLGEFSALESQWDGSNPAYTPSVSLAWAAAPSGTVSTKVLNLTTGDIVYFGVPTTRTATDTAPAIGELNRYEVSHAAQPPAVGVTGQNFTAGGVAAGRAGGFNIYGAAMRSNKGISFNGFAQTLYPLTSWQLDVAYNEIKAMGARFLRVYSFTSFEFAGTLYPTLGGALDETAAVALDRMLAYAQHEGLVVLGVLTDKVSYAYWRGGGNCFTGWGAAGGSANFYTDATAKANFATFLDLLLERTNTFTGQKVKEMSHIVYQLTNEEATPAAWSQHVIDTIRAKDADAVVIDGEFPAVATPTDGRDRHSNGITGANIAGVVAGVAADGVMLMAEIYGGDYGTANASSLLNDDLEDLFAGIIAQTRIRVIAQWTYAEKGDLPGTNTSENGIGGGVAAGVDWYTNSYAAHRNQLDVDPTRSDKGNMTTDWQGHVVAANEAMNGEDSPAARLDPPQAFLGAYSRTNGYPTIGWRGSPGATSYVIQQSTTAPDSGFADLATGLEENDCPYTVASLPSGRAWYRFVPLDRDGDRGTAGTVVQVG